ncbi:hypothetical protein BFR04_06640 [Gaetbulibacter sp. 4G1]|nr:hypothetical protein [Gaetbulibacter sp. 4G1]PIA79192.1 hypothetical protein BFR04_06640 [Gaetbulibacter sp. 4G1]
MSDLKRLIKNLDDNTNFKTRFEQEPVNVLKEELQKSHPILNERIFLIVVRLVGGALLLSIVLGAYMLFGKEAEEVDSFFVMIASACIGALAGLLAPSPREV